MSDNLALVLIIVGFIVLIVVGLVLWVPCTIDEGRTCCSAEHSYGLTGPVGPLVCPGSE